MSVLGMKFCGRKKCFYVDGHEKEDVVMYRKEYVTKYFID